MPNGLVPSSAVPTLTIGGRVFTDLTNLIRLNFQTGAANNFCTMRLSNGTSGYQVPVGKTLRIAAIEWSISAAASAFVDLHYSDNDLGFASATARTNPVLNSGVTDATAAGVQGITTAAAGSYYTKQCDFTVPAQKYPGIQDGNNTSGLSGTAYGYLE
jgi:hypothetical protein